MATALFAYFISPFPTYRQVNPANFQAHFSRFNILNVFWSFCCSNTISNRSRLRAPNLTSLDRVVLGLTTLFVSPHRIPKLAAVLKPDTLLKFHNALVDQKCRLLFSSSSHRRKPGPKGPSAELVAAIVELKRRNPKSGCVRIAQQISHAFSLNIDKDVVRRVLEKHYRPGDCATNGPSWLIFIGRLKDRLWSVDLFRR